MMNSSSTLLLMAVRMYIYALPFTYALSMGDGRLTISLIISTLLFTLLSFRFITHGVVIPQLKISFLFFLGFLLLLFFSQVFSFNFTPKSINHFLAYSVSIIGFGFVPMLAVANITNSGWADVLMHDIMRTARLAAFAAVFQFIIANYFGIFFESLIYYPDTIESNSIFLGLFFRSRGFAAEPGHYAFILELLAPLLLYGHTVIWKKSSLVLIADLILVLLAFLSTGSPAGLFLFVAGFLLAGLMFPSGYSFKILWFSLIASVITIGISNFAGKQANQSSWSDLLSLLFIGKLDSFSALDRVERLNIALKLIDEASLFQLLIGYGPAVYESQNLGEQTIIQFYLLLFLEAGALGMLFFLSGFVYLITHAIKRLGSERVFYFWALLSLAMHYFLISNYYYPMIWFMFPLLLIMKALDGKR